jgi:topoisomerase-4 subunit A
VYSVPVATLPGARGDGQPITTLIELESGTQLLHYFAGPGQCHAAAVGQLGGYGFLATVDNMVSRQKAGKAFMTCNEGETLCAASHVAKVVVGGTPQLVARPRTWPARRRAGAS